MTSSRHQMVESLHALKAFVAEREKMTHPNVITEANGKQLTLDNLRAAVTALEVQQYVEHVWAQTSTSQAAQVLYTFKLSGSIYTSMISSLILLVLGKKSDKEKA